MLRGGVIHQQTDHQMILNHSPPDLMQFHHLNKRLYRRYLVPRLIRHRQKLDLLRTIYHLLLS